MSLILTLTDKDGDTTHWLKRDWDWQDFAEWAREHQCEYEKIQVENVPVSEMRQGRE